MCSSRFPFHLRKIEVHVLYELIFVIMCYVCLDLVIYGWLIELWWYMVDGYYDYIVDHERNDESVYFDVS